MGHLLRGGGGEVRNMEHLLRGSGKEHGAPTAGGGRGKDHGAPTAGER